MKSNIRQRTQDLQTSLGIKELYIADTERSKTFYIERERVKNKESIVKIKSDLVNLEAFLDSEDETNSVVEVESIMKYNSLLTSMEKSIKKLPG